MKKTSNAFSDLDKIKSTFQLNNALEAPNLALMTRKNLNFRLVIKITVVTKAVSFFQNKKKSTSRYPTHRTNRFFNKNELPNSTRIALTR